MWQDRIFLNLRPLGVSKGQKKERPYCTYCNIHGHNVDKCYKIHGYPPGYNIRQKGHNIVTGQVNQIIGQEFTMGRKEKMLDFFSKVLMQANTSSS